MAAIRRFLLRLMSFFRSGHEDDLAREIRTHLQLLEDQCIAQGMSADEARYAARRAFGGVEQAPAARARREAAERARVGLGPHEQWKTKERQRDTRSFRSLDGWWLDLKLGVRLLIKYPGLTLVGGLAIAFAIATGAATFVLLTKLVRPTLPLDHGDRIVGIRLWHTAARG